MKNIILLNLRQFDGEGDGTESTGAQAETDTRTQESDSSQVAAEKSESEQASEEDLEKEFDTLIKGKYKEQFNARQQKAIKSRFQESEATKAELQAAAKLKDTIALRYGLENASTDDIIAAVQKDESFLEEAAAKAGLSTAQYRSLATMQQRAVNAERALEEEHKAKLREDFSRKLQNDISACQKVFPDFDFETECAENEQFKQLVKSGVDMTKAYKFVHMDELMADGMAMAAHKGAENTAKAVKNNLRRPNEAGASGQAAVTIAVDFSKMSDEEFRTYQEKLMAGEI